MWQRSCRLSQIGELTLVTGAIALQGASGATVRSGIFHSRRSISVILFLAKFWLVFRQGRERAGEFLRRAPRVAGRTPGKA